jgi:large subunit ribosomal protein L10e
MGLRKGHCYTPINRSYTRKSKVRSKSYIKAIPPLKIAKFNMGDLKGFNAGKYSFKVCLIFKKALQLRDNSIESSRQFANRLLDEKLKGSYYFLVAVYPHHILRENKMLTGAGADRMQTGMQLSFGTAVGIAAQIGKNKSLFEIYCTKETVPFVRKVLDKIKTKLPGEKTVTVEEVKQ